MNFFLSFTFAFLATLLPATATDFDQSHSKWHADLQLHVKNGSVNYQAWSADPKRLDAYLKELEQAQPGTWTSDEKLALWINAYNAWTVKHILNYYPFTAAKRTSKRFPVNSIRQVKGIWKEFKMDVAGRNLSLDQMEHEIMRKEHKEPRIHFAIVCASIGCPSLSNEAFVPQKLESQLTERATHFSRDKSKNRVDHADRKIYLSKIFDWFGGDFDSFAEGKQKGTVSFVAKHLSTPDKRKVLGGKPYSIGYLDYDWSLNGE